MRASEISSMIVSCYYGCFDRNVAASMTLKEFLTDRVCANPQLRERVDKMRQYRKHTDDYDRIKRTIPCCTPSCVCEQYRATDRVCVRNNIICIDIDSDDNPKLLEPGVIEAVSEALYEEPHTYAVGTSCSGNGIFCIMALSSNDDKDDFEDAFRALSEDFAKSHIIIDKHCKDVTRLRIASPETIRIKPDDTEIECYDRRVKEPEREYAPIGSTPFNSDQEQFLVKLIEMLIDAGYQSESYNQWLCDGFALHVLGDTGYRLFVRLSEKSPGYKGESDVKNKWNQTSGSKFTLDTCCQRYFSRASRILGPGWKYKVESELIENKMKINN